MKKNRCNILKNLKQVSFLTLLWFLFSSFLSVASAAEIKGLRIGQGAGGARVVFDADNKFEYNAFLIDNPKRLVVDVKNIKVNKSVERTQDKSNIVGKIRIGDLGGGKSRIVFDLKKTVIIKKDFMLPPQASFAWRLAIDISHASEREFDQNIGKSSPDIKNGHKQEDYTPVAKTGSSKKIIVIDPGHGGRDPGAIGYSGVYEKNITLMTAKELKRQLDAKGKYKVFLTRSRDIFIPLRQRMEIARKNKADLFISVHADSAPNRKATGLSVYTLSETASDKEAAALAERENKADVISGLNLVEQSKEVSDVLISLAQRESRNRSSELARCMEIEMKKAVKLVTDTHRFAGFAVLKAPDVPSVLLEIGYLSNKNEERLLRQESYRKKIATSVVKSIDRYFEDMKHKSLF